MHVRYVIPPFQRSYVWNEEDQWEPLWEDVIRTAEHVLEIMDGQHDARDQPMHFFGAVVLQNSAASTGYILRKNVVDGQQRLTTLQILMDAVQEVVAEYGNELDAEALRDLVLNNPKAVQREDERFKVWPTRRDRAAFVAAMTDGAPIADELADSQIVLAHRYFRRQALEWAELDSDPNDVQRRLAALSTVLHRHLQVVAIDLAATDNEQMIFEALNARGTQLLATDLVKNYVFRVLDETGADVDVLEREYWGHFDDDWWHEDVLQGRYNRPRIDMFLQYWLTMRLSRDVPNDDLFAWFRRLADADGIDRLPEAIRLLSALRSDAGQFQGFAELDPASPEGTFYYRVVEGLQLGAFTPVLLWLLAERHAVPSEQRTRALAALESWAVRRMLLRFTTKDINKLTVALLSALSAGDSGEVGQITEHFLTVQTAATRYWPRDDEVTEMVVSGRLYGMVKQGRIRVVLEAIEDWKRSAKSEFPRCPRGRLQIEHVMPQSWQEFWSDGVEDDPDFVSGRDRIVQTLGNLTLVTDKLNPALANLPWDDASAGRVRPGAIGKRKQFNDHSLLMLNRELVDDHPDAWTESDITARGQRLATAITEIWPGPQSVAARTES